MKSSKKGCSPKPTLATCVALGKILRGTPYSDGVHGVIEERDHDRFHAVFDAIVDVYVKAEGARDAGGSLPDR